MGEADAEPVITVVEAPQTARIVATVTTEVLAWFVVVVSQLYSHVAFTKHQLENDTEKNQNIDDIQYHYHHYHHYRSSSLTLPLTPDPDVP